MTTDNEDSEYGEYNHRVEEEPDPFSETLEAMTLQREERLRQRIDEDRRVRYEGSLSYRSFPEEVERYEGYEEYDPVTEVLLPPLETLISKPAVKLPTFGDLQNLKSGKTREEIIAIKVERLRKGKKGSKQVKRIRLARPIYELARNFQTAVFYRYVRMPDKNTKIGKRITIGPMGGACLMINIVTGTSFKFSYSICDNSKVFIKDEGKRLCQERYWAGSVVSISDVDKTASFLDNIERAFENFAFNANREGTEPKLSQEYIPHGYNTRKLYKLIKERFKIGEDLCLEKI